MPVPILDQLRHVLEHSHNAYTFRYRCRGVMINIGKKPDNSIVAYYSDDRYGSDTVDTKQPAFDRISYFYRQ